MIGKGGAPRAAGPDKTVGPFSIIEGDVIIIDPGVMTIELAPHKIVTIASAVTVSAAPTVTVPSAPTLTVRLCPQSTSRL